MRERVSSLISGLPVSARETVEYDTPAARATSLIVTCFILHTPNRLPRQNDWRGVKGISFCAPKTYNANVAIDLKPDFTSFTVGILQTQDRVANAEFEKVYLP